MKKERMGRRALWMSMSVVACMAVVLWLLEACDAEIRRRREAVDGGCDTVEWRCHRLAALEELSCMDARENLMEALVLYGAREPYVVYCQAVLETGDFTSRLYREDNNLFGLWDARNGRYMRFGRWTESVECYMEHIQNRYTGGDYYEFLDSIGYAEDPFYTRKLRELVEEYETYD